MISELAIYRSRGMHHDRHSVVSAYLFFRVPRVLDIWVLPLGILFTNTVPLLILGNFYLLARQDSASGMRIRALRVSCQFGVLRSV